MIENIVEWSIRNRFLVILASIAVGIAGFRALMTMPVDAIPDQSEKGGTRPPLRCISPI